MPSRTTTFQYRFRNEDGARYVFYAETEDRAARMARAWADRHGLVLKREQAD